MVDPKITQKFMTAREDVAHVREAKTPLYQENSEDGRHNKAFYTKAVELVLVDGGLLYGCTWDDCLHTAGNPTTIAGGHYKIHELTPDLRRTPFKDWTLEQILGRLQDAEDDLSKVIKQRDTAEARADKRIETVKAAAKKEILELKAAVTAMESEVAKVRAAATLLFGPNGTK